MKSMLESQNANTLRKLFITFNTSTGVRYLGKCVLRMVVTIMQDSLICLDSFTCVLKTQHSSDFVLKCLVIYT